MLHLTVLTVAEGTVLWKRTSLWATLYRIELAKAAIIDAFAVASQELVSTLKANVFVYDLPSFLKQLIALSRLLTSVSV
jgi:hypothetical protein